MSGTIRVLYVDDEPGLLEIGKLFLEQAGQFTVETQTSAPDGLARLRVEPFDAIISDYQMMGMDGIEFLRTVRSSGNTIPFILFTGRGREEVVIEALNEGADFYLQKGGEPTAQFAELAHKIRQAVTLRRVELLRIESEKRLADIINFLPDATFAIDRNGHVIAWNRAIEEMTGVSAGRMIGKGDYEYAIPFYGSRRKILIDLIFEPDDVIAKNYSHIIHEKDVLIADTSLPRPQRNSVTLMGKASPLYDNNGEIVGAIESIRDITERKKAEDAELRAKKDWETIFRAIGHPAMVLDAQNRIIEVNDATLTVTGRSREALKGLKCYEVFHGKDTDRPPPGCPFEALRKTGSAETSEMEVETLNGYYTITCTPVYNEDGNLEKVIHIAMDVTARRRAEDELRAAYEQISASEEELKENLNELTRQEQTIRDSESRLRYMLGFYEMARGPERKLMVYAVEGAGAVTASPLGYLAFLNHEETEMSMYAWSKNAMEECSMREKPIVYPVEKTGLWGEAVRQRCPVITNNYAAPNPKKKGYPEGHPQIIRHMNLPILDGDHIVIVAGVANKSSDYTEHDVHQLTLLIQGLWQVITRRRTEEELRAAHEQLTASEEELREQYDELAQSEQRVRESEQKYRELAELLPQIVFEMDKDFTITFVNRQTYAALGYSAEEAGSGFNALSIIDPGQHGRVMENIRKMVAREPFEHTEYTFRRKDGSTFPGLIYADPVFRNGELTGFRGIIIDITDRTRQERIQKEQLELGLALQKVHGLTETLETCLASAIRVSDMDAGAIYLADPVTGSFDLVVAQNLSSGFTSCVSRFPADSANARMVMAGKPVYAQFGTSGILHTPAQEREGLRAAAFFPITSGGRVAASLNVASRVLDEVPDTARLAIETIATQIGAALERIISEDALRLKDRAMASSINAIVIADMGGRITYVNDAFTRMWGYTAQESLGMPVTLLGSTDEEVENFVTQFKKQGYAVGESVAKRKDGTPLHIQISGSLVLNESGEPEAMLSTFIDISERRRAETELRAAYERVTAAEEELRSQFEELAATQEELRKQQQQLEEMAGTVPGVVYQFFSRPDGKVGLYYVSKRAPEVFGISSTVENFFERFTEHVDARDREAFRQSVSDAVKAGLPWHYEGRFIRPSGEGIWFEGISRPIRHGTELIYHGILSDVTERKRGEAVLQRNINFTRTLLEAIPTPVFYKDRDGKYLGCNRAFTDITGTEPEALVGKTVFDLWPPELAREYHRKDMDLVQHPEHQSYEFDIKDRDGKSRPVIYAKDVFTDESGDVAGIVGAFIDISELKRAEEELRENRDLLDQTQHITKTGGWEWDVERQTMTWTDETHRIHGMTPGQLPAGSPGHINRSLACYDPADRRVIEAAFHRCVVEGQPYDLEFPLTRSDGPRIWIRTMAHAVKANDRVIKVVGTIMDITQRKQVELALLKANRKLALLSSVTRHDIQNKVSIQLGHLALARKKGKNNMEMAAFIEKLESAAQAIQHQIEFTRTYQDLGSHEPQWQDLHRTLAKIPVPAHLSVSDDCAGTEVFADVMLEKVLANLIDNTIRHGGNVTQISMTAEEADGTLIIRYEDNGIGIPADEKQKIFERGYGKNTGLGLFLAREILEITGIMITETGEPGKGARFEMAVPKNAWRIAGEKV